MAKKRKRVSNKNIGAKPQNKIKYRLESLRRRYPELQGKVVDFVDHNVEDGVLYFSIRFKDKTNFSLRYRCGTFCVGADLCDVKTGNFEVMREYMKLRSKL